MSSGSDILSIDTDIRKKLNGIQLDFYISETLDIIEQYKNFLKIPKKISFIGTPVKTDNDNTSKKLISSYMAIAKKYIDTSVYDQHQSKKDILCMNCNEPLELEITDENSIVCNHCSSEQQVSNQITSFADTERINISNKFAYDRKTHFRECINQYHGKQNVCIPQQVYDDLEKQFIFHGLLDMNATTKTERYKNVTKKNIMMFLKEMGYSKHYENINLIYTTITGVKLDDISYIYENILADFDILSELYDKKFANQNRKNFINTQYVLFQILRKNNHNCKRDDFTNLKTIDRKFFHENILKSLFEDLGWNYNSIF